MDVKWDAPLRKGQRLCPVMLSRHVVLPACVITPTDEQLEHVFKTHGYKLQTWGRTPNKLRDDPHWIALSQGTPLHFDPKYPRYSHHLKVRVDSGVFVRGVNLQELHLTRGTFYVLDAHSPHQVLTQPKGARAWNVAVSIDADEVLDPKDTIKRCMQYAMEAPFLP